MMVLTLPFTKLHFFNLTVQLVFDAILVKACGWNALAYLIMSSFLAGSLHPCAGHFIAEHVGSPIFYPLDKRKSDAHTNEICLPV